MEENELKIVNEDIVKIEFGSGKSIELYKWKGRERRLIQQAIEDGSVGSSALEDILIYNKMVEKKYLTEYEINYATYVMYARCFSDDILINWRCEECDTFNVEKVEANDLLSQHMPITLEEPLVIKDNTIEFKVPQYTEDEMAIIPSLTRSCDKNFYNMLLWMTVNGVKEEDIGKQEDILEQFEIEDFDRLQEHYNGNVFRFTPVQTLQCSCGHEMDVFCDYLPNILK